MLLTAVHIDDNEVTNDSVISHYKLVKLRQEEHYWFIFCLVMFDACSCSSSAVQKNQELEFERNRERFLFLKVRQLTIINV